MSAGADQEEIVEAASANDGTVDRAGDDSSGGFSSDGGSYDGSGGDQHRAASDDDDDDDGEEEEEEEEQAAQEEAEERALPAMRTSTEVNTDLDADPDVDGGAEIDLGEPPGLPPSQRRELGRHDREMYNIQLRSPAPHDVVALLKVSQYDGAGVARPSYSSGAASTTGCDDAAAGGGGGSGGGGGAAAEAGDQEIVGGCFEVRAGQPFALDIDVAEFVPAAAEAHVEHFLFPTKIWVLDAATRKSTGVFAPVPPPLVSVNAAAVTAPPSSTVLADNNDQQLPTKSDAGAAEEEALPRIAEFSAPIEHAGEYILRIFSRNTSCVRACVRVCVCVRVFARACVGVPGGVFVAVPSCAERLSQLLLAVVGLRGSEGSFSVRPGIVPHLSSALSSSSSS